MGKRGPKKEPAAMAALKGNPGRRPLGSLVELPRAVKRMPRRPAWLQGKGRTLWESLGPELLRVGLMSAMDAAVFAVLCQVWSDWRDARSARERQGDVIVTSTGYRAATAEYFIERQLRMDLIRLAGEFGMTPSSRSGLHAASDEQGSVLQQWLKAKLAKAQERKAPGAAGGGKKR